MDPPVISNTLTRADRSIPSAVSCILWRSITEAESLLMGLGVLFTTILKIHCSQLSEEKGSGENEVIYNVSWNRWIRYQIKEPTPVPTYTTFSSCETRPKSWRVARLSKKLRVKQPCKNVKEKWVSHYLIMV
jgi:hypothetical protein